MTTTIHDGNGKEISLRDYIKSLFDERDRYYTQRIADLEKRVEKLEKHTHITETGQVVATPVLPKK